MGRDRQFFFQNQRSFQDGAILVWRQDFSNPHTATALKRTAQAFGQVDGSAAGPSANEVSKITGFDRQRKSMARLHESAGGRPEERKPGSNLIELHAKTFPAQVQKRNLLLLDE